METQHLDFTCNNQSLWNTTSLRKTSHGGGHRHILDHTAYMQVLLAYFSNDSSWVSVWHNVAWAEAYLPTKWNFDPSSRLATTDMGRKLGLCPFGEMELDPPSNTMWPGPSFILIHPIPTVWPQYTNVTDMTDRQTDDGPIAYGEPFYKRSPKNLLIFYTKQPLNYWVRSQKAIVRTSEIGMGISEVRRSFLQKVPE